MSDDKPSGVKDQKISTYSFVPGEVVYDPDLHDGMVRVYAAISGLCGSKGFCDASNSWFAWKLHKTPWTVSKIIKKLERSGHIVTMVIASEGNQRYIMTLNDKQLQILAKATTIKRSKHTAGLLSSKAIALLSSKARAIVTSDNPPIVVDDNHREVKEEEEREEPPTPVFKKGSKEDIAWQNYQTVKSKHYLTFDNDFFDFFEQEVLGRFSKQEVSIATLNDWYSTIWKVYDTELVIEKLKLQKTECNAWQVKWMQLNKRLKAEVRQKKKMAEKEARKAEETQNPPAPAETRTMKEIDMELFKNDPAAFMEQYNNNPFFRAVKENDPEFKALIDEHIKRRKKA